MKSDTEFMRKGKPWFFTNLSSGIGVEEITQFLESHIPNNPNEKNVHYLYIGFHKKLRLIQNESSLVNNFYFIPLMRVNYLIYPNS